jgi:hypothetical protein
MQTSALVAYRQTTEYTCALSSYMTAMHELFGHEISPERERHLWQVVLPWYVRPFRGLLAKYVGTPPCNLARYIQKHDKEVCCKLFTYRKNLEAMDKRRKLIGSLCSFHDWFMRVFIPLKPRADVLKVKQTAGDVLGYLEKCPDGRVLQVIAIQGGLVHFILIRRDGGGGVVVMDPHDGTNTTVDAKGLAEKYGPVLFGYSIGLCRRAAR